MAGAVKHLNAPYSRSVLMRARVDSLKLQRLTQSQFGWLDVRIVDLIMESRDETSAIFLLGHLRVFATGLQRGAPCRRARF